MSRLVAWESPPPELSLPSDVVHVWRVALDVSESVTAQRRALLTLDERERADRFLFDNHRRQFTVCRGTLRLILGRYLGSEPQGLAFAKGAHQKPYLAESAGDEPLHFNVSHSGAVALIGVSRQGEVGVDVEQRRPLDDLDSLATRSFSAWEYRTLKALPPDEQLDAFYTCWARKEAFIKCTGQGLSRDLASFDVTFAPGVRATLVRVDDRTNGDLPWSLGELPPISGYAVALAVAGHLPDVRTWCWDPGLPEIDR